MPMLPRGLRNNNPGNIRWHIFNKETGVDKICKRWNGEIRPSRDTCFCTFDTIVYGYRAMLKLLRNYRLKNGCRTVSDYINKWAPPKDNNHTLLYIKSVCEETGLLSSHEVDIDNETEMCKIVEAMAHVENGKDYISYIKMVDIEAGWNIL